MEAWPAEIPPVDLTPDKTQTPLVENATLGISRSQKKERKRMNLFVPNLIFYRITIERNGWYLIFIRQKVDLAAICSVIERSEIELRLRNFVLISSVAL